MKADYAECERRVLLSEGGYTNDPRDPGGPTNWGITITDARLYWKPHASALDVRHMPRSVACDIYKKKYWDALDADELPAGVDYTVFDYGVNSGIGRAGKVLRRVLGLMSNTWHVTPDVIEKLKHIDPKHVVEAINAERLHFLEGLHTWSHFGKGWASRVHSVDAFSLHLAANPIPVVNDPAAPAPHVTPDGQVMAKAPAPDDHPIHAIALAKHLFHEIKDKL